MRTGLTKKQKTTVIYFDEHSRMIEVQTHNTDLKKRLTAFAAKFPQCCRQTDDDEQGGLTFEIEKGRLSFRLTAPYSEKRSRAQARQRKSAAFIEKTPDGKIIMLDKFTWQQYNNDKKTWKGAILFNE